MKLTEQAGLLAYSADPMKSTRRKKEWFGDDSFWRELHPFMFPEKRIAEADGQIAKVLALTSPKGKSVLDLCCGPDRCSVALARRGFQVTGVDKSTYLLNKARARARAARVKVEWVRMDMLDFARPGSFALVLSMFTSFGYFDDKQEDVAVLDNMFTSLQPGGACLIEVLGKERLARILLSTTSSDLPDGTVLVERHRISDDWTRVRNEWLVIGNGRVRRYKFHHTIYSGQELRDRMERVGFVAGKLYGSLNGDEDGPDSERLIAIGRRPKHNRSLARHGLRALPVR